MFSKEITTLEIICFILSTCVLLFTVLWAAGFKKEFFSRLPNPTHRNTSASVVFSVIVLWSFSTVCFSYVLAKLITMADLAIVLSTIPIGIILLASVCTTIIFFINGFKSKVKET